MGGSVCHQEVQGGCGGWDGMGCTDVNDMSFWNNNTHMSQEECSESGVMNMVNS
jgi:hypothetical protein